MRRLNAPNSCDEALATKVLRLENFVNMYVDPTFNYGLKFMGKKSSGAKSIRQLFSRLR